MNILLCGAAGFIGQHIHQTLLQAGHVVRSLHQPLGPTSPPLRFAQATCPSRWRPWLDGVDAVVNSVGVLRDSPAAPMSVVHSQAPIALFQAAADAGVRRVLHLSALGLKNNPRLYAQSKLAAESALLHLNERDQLDAVLLQPSVVFGPDGSSSRLFMHLAQWPWLALPPAAFDRQIQPVAVQDLVDAVLQLLRPACEFRGPLAVVGARALTLSDFIQLLRQQQGRDAARHVAMPQGLADYSARLGDLFPFTSWGQDALSLMGGDHTADKLPLAALLGRQPRSVDDFLNHPAAWQSLETAP